MPLITFIDHQGVEREVDGANGDSLMETAVSNDIPGIDADCGGGCACATCHVFIDEAFQKATGEADDMEQQMLEFAENVAANSRLSCQIFLTDELDGLHVTTPESQH